MKKRIAVPMLLSWICLVLAVGGCSRDATLDAASPVAPEPAPQKAFPVLFFISDVQIDEYSDNLAAQQLAAIINGRFAYDAGDVVEHGTEVGMPGLPRGETLEYQMYCNLFPLAVGVPCTRAVPGNHDYYDGLLDWPWGTTLVDEYRDGVHVVGFDSALMYTHQQWLADALDDDAFTILFMHHPLYSDNVRNGAAAETVRAVLGDIVAAADLVVCGHGHAYEHHLVNGKHHLVIGGGGAPLDTVGDSGTQVISESVHHYLEVQVRTASAVLVTARRLDGSIIEQFAASRFPKETTIYDREQN